MKRRDCIGLLAGCALYALAVAHPDAQERARIDRLIQAVGKRSDIKFIRNGSEHDSVEAAEFLQGKLKWRISKVTTVQDFIDQIGTRSTTSGEIYQVQLADGKKMPSAEFLRQELARIEQR
ncbi:MAG: DUF5329 family protein [Rubrivivax sp.]